MFQNGRYENWAWESFQANTFRAAVDIDLSKRWTEALFVAVPH